MILVVPLACTLYLATSGFEEIAFAMLAMYMVFAWWMVVTYEEVEYRVRKLLEDICRGG